jgi:hypothetical protein
MIPGDHDRSDAGSRASFYSRFRLGPRRVDDSKQAEKYHFPLGVRYRRIGFIGNRQDAQRLFRHLAGAGRNRISILYR